jgi:hypothetical protein
MFLHDQVADIAFRYQFKKNAPTPQVIHKRRRACYFLKGDMQVICPGVGRAPIFGMNGSQALELTTALVSSQILGHMMP